METKNYIFGEIRALTGECTNERTVDFVISTGEKDRYRTVINPENWALENYNKNGIVGYQHAVYGDRYNDPDNIIGSGFAWIENDLLIGRVTFETEDINEKAEKIFKKVQAGTLKAASVGFRELTDGKWGEGDEALTGANPTYYYGKVELLEFSIVTIPGNASALKRNFDEEITAAKNKELQEAEQQRIKEQQEIDDELLLMDIYIKMEGIIL